MNYINIINQRLSYLQLQITNDNSLNLNNINIHAENFYRDLFNLLGFSFDNTNSIKQNFEYIDLIDSKNKLAIQVTSQNDSTKIKKSIDGFFSNSENKDYKLKILLISKEAKTYKTPFGNDFNHDEDVIDIKKLLKKINNETTDVIKQIADFLDKEILTERKATESTEVQTIMSLIDYLSNDDNVLIETEVDFVDPKNKIYNRFSDHSTFIVEQYQEQYQLYFLALLEARKKIDGIKARKISMFLKEESDLILNQENNNPKTALNKLVDFFYAKLSVSGYIFDKGAIRFYLLDELIQCNVFPNKE